MLPICCLLHNISTCHNNLLLNSLTQNSSVKIAHAKVKNTLSVPTSFQRRTIEAAEHTIEGMSFKASTLVLLIPRPRRKKACIKTTGTPALMIPFFRYCSLLGNSLEANHIASLRNEAHKSPTATVNHQLIFADQFLVST